MHFFLMRYHYRINALVNLATMKGWMEVTSPPPLPLLSLASGQSIFLGGWGGGYLHCQELAPFKMQQLFRDLLDTSVYVTIYKNNVTSRDFKNTG